MLVCPECLAEFTPLPAEHRSDGDIWRGRLECRGCGRNYPIESGIPRFVERHSADASFGYQWNVFRREQLDSLNGTTSSARRLHTESGWTAENLDGTWVLDVGCGAGRFLEVVARYRCEVVGVDASRAIDAAAITATGKRNVHLVQADVYRLPFRSGAFDACYCIGVAQHTPDPLRALASLPRVMKPGGRIAITVYERKPWTRLNGKYLLRPLTRRLSKRALLVAIRLSMPLLFPLTEVLFRLPVVGRAVRFALPVANYVELEELSVRQRYRWAILDTFDRLAPEHDHPLAEPEVMAALSRAGITNLRRLPNPGLNLVGERRSERACANGS